MSRPPAAAPTRRLGLIGHGRIGAAVAAACRAGQTPGWQLAGALVREPVSGPLRDAAVELTHDSERFFAQPLDLIVECAGPAALAQHGERALAVCEVWTVSAVALADPDVEARLHARVRASGHRLRVLHGAIAGLDGVMASAVDPDGTLQLDIDLLPGPGPRAQVFEGSVREAARRYPHHVNVAVAAALAGPGLDASRIRVHHPGPGPEFALALQASGRFGTLDARVAPRVAPGVHPVAASIVAALRQAVRPIWVG